MADLEEKAQEWFDDIVEEVDVQACLDTSFKLQFDATASDKYTQEQVAGLMGYVLVMLRTADKLLQLARAIDPSAPTKVTLAELVDVALETDQ